MFKISECVKPIVNFFKEEETYNIENEITYKNYKNYDKFCKSMYLLDKLKEEDWIPKLIYDNINSVYTKYCGNDLTLEKLPTNWENQLNRIRNRQKHYGILITKWGPNKFNNQKFDNIKLLGDKIYFSNINNSQRKSNEEIDKYFDHKINYIKLLLKHKHENDLSYIYPYTKEIIFNLFESVNFSKILFTYFMIDSIFY